MDQSVQGDGGPPPTARVPAQATPARSGSTASTRAQVHAARNSLYAVRIATYSLAVLGPSVPAETRDELRRSIEGELDFLRELLDL